MSDYRMYFRASCLDENARHALIQEQVERALNRVRSLPGNQFAINSGINDLTHLRQCMNSIGNEARYRLSRRCRSEIVNGMEHWSGYQHDCAAVAREMGELYPGFRLEVVLVYQPVFSVERHVFTADGDVKTYGSVVWEDNG